MCNNAEWVIDSLVDADLGLGNKWWVGLAVSHSTWYHSPSQYSIMAKSGNFEVRLLGFLISALHLVAVFVNFPNYKMGIIAVLRWPLPAILE